MTDSSQPVAGWYPDPENATAERWWDGTGWTDHRRPSTVPPVAPPAPAADPNAFAAPGASLAGTAPAPTQSATVSPYASPAAAGYGAQGDGASGYAAPGYAAPAYTPAQPANTLAVVGLVVALGGLLFSFGGLTSLAGGIISTVALARASKMRRQGLPGHRWGMALAGTICGYALFVVIVALFIVGISFLVNNPEFGSYDSTLS